MAFVQTGSKLLVGANDLSADLHTLTVNYASEILDATTFGCDTRRHMGGLKTASIDGQGYVNLGSSLSDPILFGNIGVENTLATAFLTGVQVGSTMQTGFGMGTVQGPYDFGGQVGALIPFTIKLESVTHMPQAIALDNALSSAWTTVPATGTGTAWNIVHCTTEEKLYAGFHVTALSTGLGTSVSALIQAASSSGFATSSNRISFTAQTCKGGTFAVPIPASALSTDQPFIRSVVAVSTGTAGGGSVNGLTWVGIE